MNCWHTLGIDPTSNVRDIKRAYAALLKQTRPDEDPEGFQQLHRAYKDACEEAKYIQYEESDDLTDDENYSDQDLTLAQHVESKLLVSDLPEIEPSPNNVNDCHRISVETVQASEPTKNLIEKEISVAPLTHDSPDHANKPHAVLNQQHDQFLRQQWTELSSQAETATRNRRAMNDINSWLFLNNHEALYDIDFKSELSILIFRCITDQLKKSKIDQPTFDYLDNIFHWSSHRDSLEEEIGYELTERLLDAERSRKLKDILWIMPSRHEGAIEHAGFLRRVLAACIDILLFTFIISSLLWLAYGIDRPDHDTGLNIVIAVLSYFMISPIMEATPLQGTPGKIILGMKVVTMKGNRLNIFHSLFRSIIFTLSTAAIKVTAWINAFVFNKGNLLHDSFSRSQVIKRY